MHRVTMIISSDIYCDELEWEERKIGMMVNRNLSMYFFPVFVTDYQLHSFLIPPCFLVTCKRLFGPSTTMACERLDIINTNISSFCDPRELPSIQLTPRMWPSSWDFAHAILAPIPSPFSEFGQLTDHSFVQSLSDSKPHRVRQGGLQRRRPLRVL